MMKSLIKAFGILCTTLFLTLSAQAEDWHVAQSTGQIWVQSAGVQQVALGDATAVPGGSTVLTGPGGRIMLTRGGQTVMVGPNAMVTVPQDNGGGMTRILQQAGEATFDVDRQRVPHFTVETPFLAAVVKGTQFTVRVDQDGAAVSVARGLVGVTALSTGESVDVKPGQRAAIAWGGAARLKIEGSGDRARIQQGTPRSAMVARLSAREFAAVQASAASSGPRGVAITDGDGADLPLADGAARGPGDAGGLTLAAAKDGPDDGQGPGGNNGALADVDDVGASLDVLANSMTGKRRVEETGPLGGYAIPAGFAVCILLGFGIAYLRTR